MKENDIRSLPHRLSWGLVFWLRELQRPGLEAKALQQRAEAEAETRRISEVRRAVAADMATIWRGKALPANKRNGGSGSAGSGPQPMRPKGPGWRPWPKSGPKPWSGSGPRAKGAFRDLWIPNGGESNPGRSGGWILRPPWGLRLDSR